MKPAWFTIVVLLAASLLFADPLPDDAKTHPENFNWRGYVNAASSTSEEMTRAQEGVDLLTKRMDQIVARYRQLLESRHDAEEVRLLEEMQTAWKKSAEAEAAFIATPWKNGSGARAAFPRARMECYLRRVKELLEMEARCMALNK